MTQGEKVLLSEIKDTLAARFVAGMTGYNKRVETMHLRGGAWLVETEAVTGLINRDRPATGLYLFWKGERYRFGRSSSTKPPRWSKG